MFNLVYVKIKVCFMLGFHSQKTVVKLSKLLCVELIDSAFTGCVIGVNSVIDLHVGYIVVR